MTTLKDRELQVLATTEEDREEMDGTNPIVNAESGPNRFSLMSMFFDDTDEGDGVQIQEDLDLGELTVTYFNNSESIELTEGAVYDWAVNHYKNNW